MGDKTINSNSNDQYPLIKITWRFGLLLKKARNEKNMTQHDLEDSSGLSLRMISDMERGLRQPILITLFKLARGLNISLSELMEQLLKELAIDS